MGATRTCMRFFHLLLVQGYRVAFVAQTAIQNSSKKRKRACLLDELQTKDKGKCKQSLGMRFYPFWKPKMFKNVQKMSKMSSGGPRFSFKSRLHSEIFVLDHFWPHHWISHPQISLEAGGLQKSSHFMISGRYYIWTIVCMNSIVQKKWKIRNNWVSLQSTSL